MREYKYWAFGAVAIGMFASVVDHGSVNVALPTIAGHFSSDFATVQWVTIGYALTISALLLLTCPSTMSRIPSTVASTARPRSFGRS